MNSYFEGSFAFSILKRFYHYYTYTIIFNAIKAITGLYKKSMLFYFLNRFINKKPTYEGSFSYKTIHSFGSLISNITDGSVIKSISSKIFGGNITRCRILSILRLENTMYVLVFYVFIDYILRNIIKAEFISGYWDELFFILVVLLWLAGWIYNRKNYSIPWTPLHFPIFFFIGAGVFIMIINSPDIKISIEGFRAVFQYILWYFAAIALIKTEKTAKTVYILLVLTAALLGAHGVYQYIAGVEMPSNWVDIAEKGVRTRAFSIVGSPNILGSIMVHMFPMAASLFFSEKRLPVKLFWLLSAGVIGLCLIVTFSRGAWLGMIIAVVVYLLFIDKRLLIPFLIAAAFAAILIPSVSDRITYMLSSQYVSSSFRGGRFGRWQQGFEILKKNLLLGVGLGHFGGAVAMNNKIPGTFYMDNYFLKTAVEMGLVGLSAFLVLVCNIAVWGLRSVKAIRENISSGLAAGAFAGICGVIVHNLGENVFEVPMMVAYFWLVTALVMFWASKNNNQAIKPGCSDNCKAL